MKAGAPLENKNAEKWDEETSTNLLNDALNLSKDKDFDFIGEIALELNVSKSFFSYLIEKFPKLKSIHTHILSNCEANCFRNGKKGSINTAMAIVNLKSNHGWTDKQQIDHTSGGDKINLTPIQFVSTKDK